MASLRFFTRRFLVTKRADHSFSAELGRRRQSARRGPRSAGRARPTVETLEDRVLPSDYALSALASFSSSTGTFPEGQLVMDKNGNLFGTTTTGGANADGAIFELARGSTTVTTLASFDGTDGANPSAGLIIDKNGNLFGTATAGGANGHGVVFELPRGSTNITVLGSFDQTTNGSFPGSTLVLDQNGDLFGTAESGGANGDGTIFEIVQGSNTITPLASFNNTDGNEPLGSVVLDQNGNLWGTTEFGGPNFAGTIFELPKGSTNITSIPFDGTTGGYPLAGLIIDGKGNVYGTSSTGGANGSGYIFEVAQGTTTISTVASFPGNQELHCYGLTMDANGDFFGTVVGGGSTGDGGVFEAAQGSNSAAFLASFSRTAFISSDGYGPAGGVVLDANGNLYGTNVEGGSFGGGTIFKLRRAHPPRSHLSCNRAISMPGTS